MDRYGVVGNPVAHSKSPQIHAQFAAQTGQQLVYERVLAPRDAFVNVIADLRQQGWRGVNVTVPFKEQAFALSQVLTDRARAAQAVNTLSFDAGQIHGDNTDGAGLVFDLTANLHCTLTGARVLLIGAGGASRGVVKPLLDAGVSELVIANRTPEKARLLAAQFAANAAVKSALLAECTAPFDIVINATSAGLANAAPVLPAACLRKDSLAYDMVYGRQPTAFMQWAAQYGARTADGLGMLVAQAAESFFVWRGVRPDAAPVLAALR
jgi:shikimate dehydrogenase